MEVVRLRAINLSFATAVSTRRRGYCGGARPSQCGQFPTLYIPAQFSGKPPFAPK